MNFYYVYCENCIDSGSCNQLKKLHFCSDLFFNKSGLNDEDYKRKDSDAIIKGDDPIFISDYDSLEQNIMSNCKIMLKYDKKCEICKKQISQMLTKFYNVKLYHYKEHKFCFENTVVITNINYYLKYGYYKLNNNNKYFNIFHEFGINEEEFLVKIRNNTILEVDYVCQSVEKILDLENKLHKIGYSLKQLNMSPFFFNIHYLIKCNILTKPAKKLL